MWSPVVREESTSDHSSQCDYSRQGPDIEGNTNVCFAPNSHPVAPTFPLVFIPNAPLWRQWHILCPSSSTSPSTKIHCMSLYSMLARLPLYLHSGGRAKLQEHVYKNTSALHSTSTSTSLSFSSSLQHSDACSPQLARSFRGRMCSSSWIAHITQTQTWTYT